MQKRTQWLLFAGMLLLASCQKKDTVTPTDASTPAEAISYPSDRRGEVSITVGDVKYVTGYSQVSKDNKDAYVFKETNGQVAWVKYYDRSPDDSHGVAINADANRLYVAFTCTGGNTGFKATAGAFQGSYGSGGGPKITYLAQLDGNNGNVLAATFIGAKLNDGKTNTLYPDNTIAQPITLLADEQVKLQAIHAYDKGDGRLTPGSADVQCTQSGGKWTGTFNKKMTLLTGDCF